jgi:murein DD-endopeptidase MepM/ murein hydrolase activator NlpD
MEQVAPALVAPVVPVEPVQGQQLQTLGAPAIKLPVQAPPPPPPCALSESKSYCVYTVQEGDTLSHIAAKFGLNGGNLPGWELLAASNKPDITSVDDFIQPGQKLRVPTALGVVHTVFLDETIGDLADVFDVTSASIIAANRLGNADLLTIGQVLLVPNPPRLEAPPSAAAQPEPSQPEPAAPARDSFVWPITASPRITNYMSPRHPLGIDLGLSHAPGADILAVAAGEVSFAGGDACCSYGLYVIVDHGNGLKTLYAHLRRLDVHKEQQVHQGQVLGPAGSTGYSTGVHLHFEVHQNGTRVNPMTFLP